MSALPAIDFQWRLQLVVHRKGRTRVTSGPSDLGRHDECNIVDGRGRTERRRGVKTTDEWTRTYVVAEWANEPPAVLVPVLPPLLLLLVMSPRCWCCGHTADAVAATNEHVLNAARRRVLENNAAFCCSRCGTDAVKSRHGSNNCTVGVTYSYSGNSKRHILSMRQLLHQEEKIC